MNKIILVNDEINNIKLDNKIKLETHLKHVLFEINTIELEIKENTDLFIELNLKEISKLQINVNLLNDVILNLYILTTGIGGKIKYTYNLNLNSNLNIYKYNDIKTIKEMSLINLNNEYACINYIFKSISKDKESYDYIVNHNCKNTISNIKNNGVNLNGHMNIQISSFIPKEIINCTANQFNRIINLTNNKCEIRPILYIDTDQVEANHSALIGDFNFDELFYLQTMGINKDDAYNLLIKGFLLSDIKNAALVSKIENDINKYWR